MRRHARREQTMQLCPHCGFNLTAARPLEYGNIAFDTQCGVWYRGIPLQLPRSQYDIVETLVLARGRGVTVSVLANRLSGDVDDATIVKYIERVRVSFRRLDPRFDQIVSLRGFGAYRWSYRSGPPEDVGHGKPLAPPPLVPSRPFSLPNSAMLDTAM